MGQIISSIMPTLYEVVKQNRFLLKIALPIWKGMVNLKEKAASLGGAKIISGPDQVFVTSKDWSDQYENKGGAGHEYIGLKNKPLIQPALPKVVGEILDPKFQAAIDTPQRDTFVLSIPGGRIVDDGFILSPDHGILADVSEVQNDDGVDPPENHPLLSVESLPPEKKVKGRVAVLSKVAGRGYYHWILEVLPRIQLIKESGIPLESIDTFVVNTQVGGFHKRTLKELGIPESKILTSHWNPHILADELIVPSMVGDGMVHTRWVADFLREHFLKGSPPADSPKRIYITRSRNNHRRVLNATEVEDFLQEYGFTAITPEEYTLTEKAQLFAGAEAVIGTHGAGMIHTVFCQPGTPVVEFFYHSIINTNVWHLASQVPVRYSYLTSLPPEEENEDVDIQMRDLTIDLHKLKETLELNGIEKQG